jgi:hypothetical protein
MNIVLNRVVQICLICLLVQTAAAERPPSISVLQLEPPNERLPRKNSGPADSESLSFYLQVEFQCDERSTATGLFVSIADTYLSTPPPDNAAISDLVIKVPRAQLLSGRTPDCAAGYEIQRLTAQTSAFSTLICRNPDGQTTSATVRTLLDVVVQCPSILPPEGDLPAADAD